MKDITRYYAVLIIILVFISGSVFGQNNQYGLSKELYSYVTRFRTGNNHSDKQTIDSLYQLSVNEKNIKAQCVAMMLYCDYYYYKNDQKRLFSTYKKTRDIIFRTCNFDYLFEPWGRIISYHLNKKEFSKAYNELTAFKNEAIRLNNKEGIGLAYRNFGNFYQAQNNPKLAIEQYKKGAEYYLNLKLYKKEFLFYCSAAFSALNFDTRQAEIYSEKALKLTPEYGNRLIPAIYSFAVAVQKDDIIKAEKLLKEIGSINKDHKLLGSNREIMYKYLTLYSLKKNNLSIAKQLIDSLINKDDSLYLKSIIAQTEGDYKAAYQFMKERFEYNDSLTNNFGQEQLANIIATYNTSNLESENARLRMHSIKMKSLFGFILLTLMLIGLVVYLYNKRLTIKKLRIEHKIADEARLNAEKADNLKSVFLQNMSHEIRTPLNAIIGFTDLLNGEEESTLSKEEKNKFKSIIHSNSERLLTLINDILDLSKLESGNYTLKYDDIQINGLCSEVTASIKSYVPENVFLAYYPCKGYENIVAHIDGQRVGQILINFLSNACKYTSQGSITLAYEVHEKDEDMIELQFSVTDTGSGIPLEKRNLIFQRFEKLNSNKAGSGLGLNICMRLAILMNGMVAIDPEYVNGSRFTLTIPARRVKTAEIG